MIGSAPDEGVVGHGTAMARAGLLGNPSDGFGGRVIAITLPQFRAKVEIRRSAEWTFGVGDGADLLAATVEQLRTELPTLVVEPGELSFDTTVPRQVGLAGSSAIITAALRCLAARQAFEWDPVELARTALQVETEGLGWAAGPQDRVVQAYEGLVDMDFVQPWEAERYVRLDPAMLPPMFVAWNRSVGVASDVVHSNVRDRWHDGDTDVRQVTQDFAGLATAGRAALDNRTAALAWPVLMNEAFALRQCLWTIAYEDQALVSIGRELGAGVTLAGSGGAVVGAVTDSATLNDLALSYERAGAGFVRVRP